MMLELTSVLPTPTSAPQSRWPPNRYAMHAARWWFGFSSPARRRDDAVAVGVGVVGERDVEAVARSRVSRAIAYGDEQSMRILPSQSSGTNRNVGSTASLTISRSSPWRSAIAAQ